MAPGCIAPMCIRVKDHSSVLCEQLQQLRQQTGLVDLDIVCEGHYIKVHKVVMAACSKFFKEQLCKYNVQALVILRLEDFGLELKRDAVNYIIEFIYSGEVNILGEKLTDFCQAAHTLGVAGLEHLPVPATRHGPTNFDKDRIQIADESELCGGNYLQFQQTPTNNENSKLPMEVNPFLNSFSGNSGPSSDDIILLSTIERDEASLSDQQDIIPISFGETTLTGDCSVSEQYRNIQDILPRNIPEMMQEQSFHEEWPNLFSNHTHMHHTADFSTNRIRTVVSSTASSPQDINMGIPGSQASIQALFEASGGGEDGNNPTVKTSLAGKPESPAPHITVAQLNQNTALISQSSFTLGGNQLKHVDSKQFTAQDQAEKFYSPGKSLSQGKLRVINQGLPQSENIQTPSMTEMNKSRRRSGQITIHHQGSGHIPSQVSQVALSSQVSHVPHIHASVPVTPRSSGVRLHSVSGNELDNSELQPIAEVVSASESEDEAESSISNTGLSTPLGNWSENSWPTSNRQNNWTHPVESVATATVPTTGAVWQLPNTDTQTKLPQISSQPWNLPAEPESQSIGESPLITVSSNAHPIPWNTPVTNAWCTQRPPVVSNITSAKWEETSTPPTSTVESKEPRDTPPNVMVSWTQPQKYSSPTYGLSGPPITPVTVSTKSKSSLSNEILEEEMDFGRKSPTWEEEDSRTKGGLSDDMLAIRSGIPLALQNKAIRSGVPVGPFQGKRKRKSKCVDPLKGKKRGSLYNKKGDLEVRRDLEVRKDLTIESQQQDNQHIGYIIQDNEEESGPSTSNVSQKTKDSLFPVVGNSSSGGVHIKTVKKLNSEYTCDQCENSFYSSIQLKQHTACMHGKGEEFFCQVCPEKCEGKEGLKVHLYKMHGVGEVFRCEECSFETPSKPGYIKHISDHIPQEEKQKKCIKCEKIFKTKYGLKLHLKEHFNERLSCIVCDFQTAQKSNLVKHMASKHSQDLDGKVLDDRYKCDKCEFRCVSEHMLKNHLLRKHTEKEAMRFQCEHCCYATVEKAALDKHRRFKHTNERPFMCDTCGFSTATASSIARHRRSHSQTKPHKCDICGHEYADKKRLRDHMYLHSDYKPFHCHICSYTSRRNDNLTAHIRKRHDVTKEEGELKAVIPDSTSESFDIQESSDTPKFYDESTRIAMGGSVLSHSISTIQISDIAVVISRPSV